MIKNVYLVQVQSIKKTHAKQIQWVDKPDLKQMVKDIHPETGDVNKAEVLGRVHGKILRDLGQVNAWSLDWCLLVKTPNGLFWMNVPNNEIKDYYIKESNAPQLFM